jgi:hypothetical protein
MRIRRLRLFLIISGAVFVSGCSAPPVKPWQRDLLSRQDMQLNGSSIDDAIDDHVYFSKEASSGGRSFAGGGCGCN